MDDKNASAKKAKPTAPQSNKPATPPAASGTNYTMPQKKGLKAWMVIVPVAGLLVITAVVILLVVLFGGPSKKDYTKALDNARDISQNYRDLSTQVRTSMSNLSSTANTDSSAEGVTQDLREAVNTYKDSVNDFKQQVALKDEEVRASYDKLKQKSEAMVSYSEGLLEALPVVAKIARSCDNLTKGSAVPSDAAFETCQAALSEGKKLKVEELRKISEARSVFVGKVQDYAKVARKSSALERLQAQSQYYAAQSTYLTAAREQQQRLRNLDTKNNVSDEINDLGRLLTRKVNEA